MNNAFNKITEHCSKLGKSKLVRDIAFCNFTTVLQQAIENQEKPTQQKIQTTSQALLTQEAIEGYVLRAETRLDEVTRTIITSLQSDRSTGDFWRGVASSIVGSFAFAIILTTTFWLGRVQT